MKTQITFLALFISALGLNAQGYDIGDKAADFSLKNVDGTMVSLSDYPQARGYIVVFTTNHCPYAIAYEDRIIEIDKEYKPKGFPVIAINPNDPDVEPRDSYVNMIERAETKGFTFPYLFDKEQTVYPKYGATRTPHVFLLQNTMEGNIVRYIGAIDDNYRDVGKVQEPYLINALDAILAGEEIKITETKAIGCTIKKKD